MLRSWRGRDDPQGVEQLDSFIERWKSDHTNALLMIGDDVSSTMFVDKIKKATPDMLIVADTTSIGDQGQNEQKAHATPNAYAGAITAEGLTGLEHSKTDHYKFCAAIWQKANPGQPAPLPNVVIKLANGHQDNKYGAMEDACLFTNLFAPSESERVSSAGTEDELKMITGSERSESVALTGPMETTTTSSSESPFSRSASSTALASKWFSAPSPERSSRFVCGSMRLCTAASGTSLTQTAIFTGRDSNAEGVVVTLC